MLSFIIWDVSPELFIIPLINVPVTWYGLSFGLSFAFGQILLTNIYKQENRPVTDVSVMAMYVALGTIVGARLGHHVFYEWSLLINEPLKWFVSLIRLPFRGLASHGAIIGILPSLYLYTQRRPDQPFLWVTDRVAIIVSAAGVLIRLGNLFNSEIYGKPTNLPWAILFVRETDPSLLPIVPRHPTQLYESFFCLCLVGLTWYLWRYKRESLPDGVITGWFLTLLFSFRFLVEFLKNNQESFEANLPLNMGQLLSIPAVLIGVMLILRTTFTRNLTEQTVHKW